MFFWLLSHIRIKVLRTKKSMDALRHFRLHILRLEAGGGGRRVALRRRFNDALRELSLNVEEVSRWCALIQNEDECEGNNPWCNWWVNQCLYDECARKTQNECEAPGPCSWWREGRRCRGVYDYDSD